MTRPFRPLEKILPYSVASRTRARSFFSRPDKFSSRPTDEGSVLIITFIFLILVSLVVTTLSSWAANGLNNSLRFQASANQLYAASGATQVAMRAARYTFPTSSSEVCPGTPSPLLINGVYIQVWCQNQPLASGFTINGSAFTRETTLSACLMPSGSAQLTGVCTTSSGAVPQLLVAVVYYDDVESNVFNPYNCTATYQSTCGVAMQVFSWVSR